MQIALILLLSVESIALFHICYLMNPRKTFVDSGNQHLFFTSYMLLPLTALHFLSHLTLAQSYNINVIFLVYMGKKIEALRAATAELRPDRWEKPNLTLGETPNIPLPTGETRADQSRQYLNRP